MPQVPIEHTLARLVRTLSSWADLSVEDVAAVLALPCTFRSLAAQQYIVWEGDRPQHSCVLLSGFAYRHTVTQGGARQILSIDIAGDFVDVHNALLGRADHNVQMITDGLVALIPTAAILQIVTDRPTVSLALWRTTLVEAAVFRQWIANVGRRDARTRIAHLLCEFATRTKLAGLSDEGSFVLPMTQDQLADAVSLTSIHVNRTLARLAAEGLVSPGRRAIKILDWQGLVKVGDFDPSYLMPSAPKPNPRESDDI